MATKSLIPMADVYIKNGKNVLLIGLHGTGKTVSIMELATEHDLRMKYYSCATLDPYTDLVGIPVPKENKSTGKEHLEMIRPRDLDEAEFIFFDEFNRADPKVINAVFEIIQFHSINGEPLPNLKCCWAAINPPDKDYNVEQLDPAMIDRFDAFIEIKPSPTVDWLSTKMDKKIAQALVSWWGEHDKDRRSFEDYVSPRRLEKIGVIYELTQNQQAVKNCLPPAGKYDTHKLIMNLEIAVGKRKKNESMNNIGGAPNDAFVYKQGAIYSDRDKIIDYIKKNQYDFETQNKIIDVLKKAQLGNDTFIAAYGGIFEVMTPSIFEGYFNALPSTKKSQIRNAFQEFKKTDPKITDALPNIKGILAKGARQGDWK